LVSLALILPRSALLALAFVTLAVVSLRGGLYTSSLISVALRRRTVIAFVTFAVRVGVTLTRTFSALTVGSFAMAFSTFALTLTALSSFTMAFSTLTVTGFAPLTGAGLSLAAITTLTRSFTALTLATAIAAALTRTALVATFTRTAVSRAVARSFTTLALTAIVTMAAVARTTVTRTAVRAGVPAGTRVAALSLALSSVTRAPVATAAARAARGSGARTATRSTLS
jgi:hypothetical protein